jgi:hypothetical protein
MLTMIDSAVVNVAIPQITRSCTPSPSDRAPGTAGWSAACLPHWAVGARLPGSPGPTVRRRSTSGCCPGRSRRSRPGLVALTSIVLYGMLVLAPVFLKQGQGGSPVEASLVLMRQRIMMGLATAVRTVVRLAAQVPDLGP